MPKYLELQGEIVIDLSSILGQAKKRESKEEKKDEEKDDKED